MVGKGLLRKGTYPKTALKIPLQASIVVELLPWALVFAKRCLSKCYGGTF